ncbi:4Fe-4S ferredoxin [[Pantoea] beijingensis]|uniref:4Fe-4S ferredoxin n=1 Tax=[Pantoea] beijingensis TaxID=1324864 RepID=A0A443IF91_9GAMM|nr:ferredoxin family protein [[Pantoea] beijingensis]RWR02711.1 4Fe-4S ferredoxin [[Pantoea] beijingensis]
MIELISETQCIACNRCVTVCPANVFDAVIGRQPVISRQQDCQTCFLCEIYCPTDALYVAPDAERTVSVNEAQLTDAGLMGSYALHLGWKRGQAGGADADPTWIIRDRYRHADIAKQE